MENKSLWLNKIKKEYLDELDKDITTDILIIGGGVSGLTTAYYLSKTNKKITLIDKDSCGFGISAHTTGKLTFVQEKVYSKITKIYNKDIASLYLQSQKDAIRLAKTIITKNNIDCNIEKTASYLFTNDYNEINKIKEEEKFYKENNINYKVSNKIPLTNYPCLYSLKINSGYVFHPVKYMLCIKKIIKDKVEIYEKTSCLNIEKKTSYYEITTSTGNKILANKVIVTCHYPFFLYPGLFPFKTSTEKSYIVSGIFNNKKFQAINSEKKLESIRFYTDKNKDYILYSGNSHKSSNHFDIDNMYKELINKYKRNINNNIKYYWTNHDIMTLDNIPYIGKIDNNLYIATGFNKWGMTNGILSGKILSDLVLNKKNKYEELFSLKRKFSLSNILNIVIYNYFNAKAYILTKLKVKGLYKDNSNIRIEVFNNKKIGVYTDKQNKEHKVYLLCPHLKCNLVFNNKDKTWDCPCHGSRFDIDGNVIYGPSKKNIKVNKKDL